MYIYNVSRASISRILQEEKKRKALEEGEEQVELHKKRRGHQSPITPSMLTWLLLELEQNSQVTLEEMVYKIENKFNVNTSASALERMLKRMAITWKNVVPILEDWNSPHVSLF
jgi:transposase